MWCKYCCLIVLPTLFFWISGLMYAESPKGPCDDELSRRTVVEMLRTMVEGVELSQGMGLGNERAHPIARI